MLSIISGYVLLFIGVMYPMVNVWCQYRNGKLGVDASPMLGGFIFSGIAIFLLLKADWFHCPWRCHIFEA